MSFLKKLGLIEDDTPKATVQVAEAAKVNDPEPEVDADINSTENIVADIYAQNGMSDTSNSIYTVRAYMEKLPSEMTTAKKQQTVAGILEVSGMSVEVLLADAAKRTEVLTAARDAVIADRDSEIATANADIEALKSAIEVAQAKIKHAEDVKSSTKNNVYDELCAIENLVEFCEGMVNQ